MKKIVLLLILAFSLSEAHSAILKVSDEDQLSGLLDSFSVAMVKKNKAWMLANLTESCIMHEPGGNTLDKTGIIRTFTEGVYNIDQSIAGNKAFKVDGFDAGGSADFSVEGVGNINGNTVDINGTYRFTMKFRKSDKGWQISEMIIANN